jgi:methionine aminotransferase
MKLPNITSSIFAVMSKMANEYGAINLSQGFPDFNCSEELINLYHKYSLEGFNQYAPMAGVPVLREIISDKINDLYSKRYNPENEITITSGATQALFTAITAIVSPGDEVIIFEPAYDSYAPVVQINGGNPVFIPLDKKDFSIDWQRVKDSLTDKTKLIIINSPHNPTGSVISVDDLHNFEEVVRDKKLFIISDEVYEHIIFDGIRHVSISESEELSQKAFVISSFGKTFHTTGWKVGYCSAPERLTNEFRKVHQFVVFAVNTPAQYAFAEYMKDKENYINLNAFYQQKRDVLLNALKGSRFKFTPARGTYFQLLDYSDISDLDDMAFTRYLTKKVHVATIPLSPFYSGVNNEKIIRLCFAKRDEVLLKAAEMIADSWYLLEDIEIQ